MTDQQRLFAKYTLSYAGIVALALAITLVVHQQVLSFSKQKVREALTAQIRNRVVLLENRLEEVESKAYTLSFDPGIRRMLRLTPAEIASNIGVIREASTTLALSNLTDSFVSQYYVWFRSPDLVLSTSQIALDVSAYYDGFLHYEDMSLGDWRRLLSSQETTTVLPATTIRTTPDGVGTRALTYVLPIPTGRLSRYNGVVFALIEEEQVLDYLHAPPLDSGDGWVCVFDRAGALLAYRGTSAGQAVRLLESPPSSAGNPPARITSAATGWTYLIELPVYYLNAEIRIVRNLLIISELIICTVGVLLAILIAWKQTRPIASMVELLRDWGTTDPRPGDVVEEAVRQLSALLDDHHAKQEEIAEVRPYLRRAFLDRLLAGRFTNTGAMQGYLRLAGLEFEARQYRIYVFQLLLDSNAQRTRPRRVKDDGEADAVIATVLSRTLSRLWGEDGLVTDSSGRRLALMVRNAGASRVDEMTRVVTRAEAAMTRSRAGRFVWGESRAFGDLLDAALYFEELTTVIESAVFRGAGDFVRAEEYRSLSEDCFYPLNQEQRVINLAKAGEITELTRLIRTILAHNCHTLKLSCHAIADLRHELLGTIHKVKRDLSAMGMADLDDAVRDQLRRSQGAASEDEFAEGIIECYRRIAELVQAAKIDPGNRLVSAARLIIEREYADASLCLQSLAEELSVSPKHLSKCFSQAGGTPFSEFLESVRMHKAQAQLRQPGTRTADVAMAVGYLSTNTFFKAFKRRFGVTPTTWRDQVEPRPAARGEQRDA